MAQFGALRRLGIAFLAMLSTAAAGGPDLPRYTPGDNFTYSDGRTETVVSVSGEAVDWKNDLGFTFRSFRNPMLPRLAWQAETRRGETVLDAAPDLLWPLAAGTEAEFVARRAVIGNDGSRRDFVQSWRCRVEAAASIIVAAGRFDAWPLRCERHDEIGAVRERRSLWYAPAIGHVVKLEEDRDGLTTRRELVAYFKFESNHSGEVGADPAQSAFQQAMERVMTGFELTWRSEDGARSITYAPVRTFQRDLLYCRDFRETEIRKGHSETRTGTACRSPDAVWRRVAAPLAH